MSSLVISPNRNPIPLLPLVIETVLLARSRRSVYLQVERHLINEGKDIYHDKFNTDNNGSCIILCCKGRQNDGCCNFIVKLRKVSKKIINPDPESKKKTDETWYINDLNLDHGACTQNTSTPSLESLKKNQALVTNAMTTKSIKDSSIFAFNNCNVNVTRFQMSRLKGHVINQVKYYS
jgi:hypothetical protein